MTNPSPAYVLKAVIVEGPSNELEENRAIYIYTGAAFAIVKSGTDKFECMCRYLRAQRDFCESYLENCSGSGLEQTFDIAAHPLSIDELAANASKHKGSRAELTHFCTVQLFKARETYLPRDVKIEFYEDVADKEM